MLTRIHATAYVVASGLGVLVLLLIGLIQGAVSIATLTQITNAAAEPDAFLPLIAVTAGLSSLVCICGGVVNLIVGGGYGFWGSRASAGADDGVLGGAASAATAQALGTLIQTGISLLAMPFVTEQLGPPVMSSADPSLLGVNLLTTGLSSLFGVCSSALIGGLLGALGGLLGAMMARRT